jgi:hypothetical protein
MPMCALLAGVLAVWGYDRQLEPYRYPYAVDSASYVEMATSLVATGAPRVTPWDPGRDPDAIPQILFPPGFSVLIAAAQPLAGDVLEAARAIPRIAAALLPMAIVWLFRGLVSDGALALVAAAAILAPGVREWQFMAYSDVPALLLALTSLGLLSRALGWTGTVPRVPMLGLLLAGLLAGIGVTVRTAGLAVVLASVLALGYEHLIGGLRRGAFGAWLLGAMLPLGGLMLYNERTFGVLQPYDMPHSTRPLWSNLLDFARSQLSDTGIPDAYLTAWPALSLVMLVALLAAAFGQCAAVSRERRGIWILLLSYVGAGAGVLVLSRTRYEWGGLIDARHTLQLAWAIALGVAMLVDGRALRTRVVAGIAALLLLGSLVNGAVTDIGRWRQWGPQAWRLLSGDRDVLAAVDRVAAEVELTSNAAAFFRLEARHAVRDVEVGGTDADFVASMTDLVALTAPRPTRFLLVCDEFTGRFSACGGPGQSGVRPPECRALRIARPRVALCVPEVRVPETGSEGESPDERI